MENTPTKFGKSFFGTGARLDGVRRLYDEFIENSLRNSSSELNQQNPMVHATESSIFWEMKI